MIIGVKNTDLKRLTRATKTSLFDREVFVALVSLFKSVFFTPIIILFLQYDPYRV
jgi:hypothetical protein